MRFWMREILGWLLVLFGLFLFWCCLAMLLNERPQYIQAGPLMVMGIIVFRGGIHLLKVAVAARLVTHAQREVNRVNAPKPAPPPRETISQDW